MPTCQECQQCPPVPVLVPVCDDPEFCAELIDTKCVVYTGPPLANLGVTTGERLDSILSKINQAINTVIIV